jgi:hypothetical protein
MRVQAWYLGRRGKEMMQQGSRRSFGQVKSQNKALI